MRLFPADTVFNLYVYRSSRKESRNNNSCRHPTACCTCIRRYYLHLHNAKLLEQYAELLAGTLPVVAVYASSSHSFSFFSPLLLRADVSQYVSRVRCGNRFSHVSLMNAVWMKSLVRSASARVYRLLNLHFRRNSGRAS